MTSPEANYALACFYVTFIILLALISNATPLAFNYKRFSDTINTLNIVGDVYQDNGALQLTEYKKDSLGRVTYYKPLHLWDNKTGKVTDFTTHFSFSINTPNKSYDGDGITFYLAEPNFPLPVPRDGSGIGLLSRYELSNPNYTNEHPFVAVEFDTFGNDWDPPYDHVGIDVKSIATAFTAEWGTYTTQWFSSRDERGYDAVIAYNSSSNNLSVAFTGYKDNVTKIEQHLSCEVNLRNVLPEWVEFGFTSATGFYFEYHTLSSWSFNTSLSTHEANDQNRSKKGLVIGLGVGAGVLICVLVLACLMGWKLRSRKRRDSFDVAMDRDFERGTGPRRFSYEELSRATNNFAKGHKIGEGGFGGVYKGFLRDLNIHVAIKRISQGSQQGVREYASEVKIISQLRHKNLVQLIGWCHRKNDLLLIYEFMENGSLDSYIFKGKSLLTWEVRYNIARGLASSLLYLHEEWEQCVLHRDIKPSNVMLDPNFNVKLGDFGLARLMDHGTESKTASLAGTMGYLAPEAATRGKASKESDVYSFGVVALEIACGRRIIEQNLIANQIHLVDWVWELYPTGNLQEAADPRLYGVFDKQEMERLMIVGLWCTLTDYTMRPTIRQVVLVLNSEVPLPTLPSQLHSSNYFIPRTSSASGNNQSQPSTSSNSSLTTRSSQSSSSATSESSKLLAT
ncbi:L-type lectin-domain containing receptor kinase IX.1-like [Arachis stenosperma]|uniref:L-type lectin-domain containing receptor kinase IX.1-like n=1 Tax=Arachis stenosperma TaxID=217475 RepID=UPI0025AB75D8|nr:L-type lectin-domain containing receptor kinase IX.1-like [Arachis stenosperma]